MGFMKGIIAPIVVASVIGVGGSLLTTWKTFGGVQAEVANLKSDLADEKSRHDRRDEALEQDLKALYEMRGVLTGLTEEFKSFKDELHMQRLNSQR